MSLLHLLALRGGGGYEPGQEQFTAPGSYLWPVPAGVRFISGVVVAPGTTGVGGGLHWRNNIPVAPLEILTIDVGLSDRLAAPGVNNTFSAVRRGALYLLRAETSTPYFPSLGGGGGFGGTGGWNSGAAGAGGAGGYMGAGGQGSNPGQPPAPNSGGGFGGSPVNDGQGVGLQGRTDTFAPGSRGEPKCGAGIGEGQNGGSGGVRLMWGLGRTYPDAAVDV